MIYFYIATRYKFYYSQTDKGFSKCRRKDKCVVVSSYFSWVYYSRSGKRTTSYINFGNGLFKYESRSR